MQAQPCDDYPSMGCTLIAKLIAGPGRPAGIHKSQRLRRCNRRRKGCEAPGLPRTRALDWTGPLRRLQHRPIDGASSSSCERATANHAPWPKPPQVFRLPRPIVQLWVPIPS